MTHNHNLVVMTAFGNDLDALVNDEYMPLLIQRLRNGATLAKHIKLDTEDAAFEKGETLRVVKPATVDEAREHGEASVATDMVVEKVDVTLDHHLYVEVKVTDREIAKTRPGALPSALEAAADKLAEAFNSKVYQCAKAVSGYSGVLDSQNERGKKSLILAKKALNVKKVNPDRVMIVSPETESDYLTTFTSGNDQKAEVEGHVGRRMGFDIYSDNQCEDHIAGTASLDDSIVTAIDVTTGSTVIVLSGATDGATLVVGDIITIGKESYSVSESVTFTGGTAAVTLFDTIRADVQAGAQVAVSGDHRGDIAFTQDAFLGVFRKLVPPLNALGVTIGEITDPVLGIPMRMLSWYNPSTESTHVKLEILFGVKAICPERAIRVGGH
ncbi:P22 phage major capsid protein family protein [Pseudomonas benzenivorans]|uniref:P22 phage major capsid protein family protein n=1 Tax=Pseudomonas benzenivorans TaxID=556533 RepID=A0ABZ0PQN8_9PSED|nr:P22 phage major capsid protein family protein [Pseudomonas benzenivorans]WPC03478.1 P22 phage major capsid protein family protein [Pseudomonas benzenivorans]